MRLTSESNEGLVVLADGELGGFLQFLHAGRGARVSVLAVSLQTAVSLSFPSHFRHVISLAQTGLALPTA